MYENDELLTSYNKKELLFEKYKLLKQTVEALREEVSSAQRKLAKRIIKEFDFENYSEKYGIDCGTVLVSLLGTNQANVFIIKFFNNMKEWLVNINI
jgi:DNA-binding protein H-NS